MNTNAIANTQAIQPSTQPSTQQNKAFSSLKSEDFLKLLITQLTNQDPLQPTSNEDLLKQIASIREIESSTSITKTLENLTQQQRFGSASSLIGQFITSPPATENGKPIQGQVVGVRFGQNGEAILRLDSGQEVPLAKVETVETAEHAAQQLVGREIRGVDQRDPKKPVLVGGIVQGIRKDDSGQVTLELDTGQDIRLSDVMEVVA